MNSGHIGVEFGWQVFEFPRSGAVCAIDSINGSFADVLAVEGHHWQKQLFLCCWWRLQRVLVGNGGWVDLCCCVEVTQDPPFLAEELCWFDRTHCGQFGVIVALSEADYELMSSEPHVAVQLVPDVIGGSSDSIGKVQPCFNVDYHDERAMPGCVALGAQSCGIVVTALRTLRWGGCIESAQVLFDEIVGDD